MAIVGTSVSRVGLTPQPRPDDPVRPAPVVARSGAHAPAGSHPGGTLGMIVLVIAEQISQFFVGITLGCGGGRGHDQHSLDELVTIPLIEIGDGIELLGRHSQARAGGADSRSGVEPWTCSWSASVSRGAWSFSLNHTANRPAPASRHGVPPLLAAAADRSRSLRWPGGRVRGSAWGRRGSPGRGPGRTGRSPRGGRR